MLEVQAYMMEGHSYNPEESVYMEEDDNDIDKTDFSCNNILTAKP